LGRRWGLRFDLGRLFIAFDLALPPLSLLNFVVLPAHIHLYLGDLLRFFSAL
jgi:hypothetical protein